MVLSVRGRRNPDNSFNWRDALIDAGIMAMLTFFTTLGGTGAAGVPTGGMLISAVISAGTQFFLILAIKRGLVEKGER